MKKKRIVIVIILIAAIALLQSVFSPFVIGMRKTELSTEQWKKDILFLQKGLASRHANIYANISKEEYNKAFHGLLNEIPSLSSDENAIRLLEIVALVGDAHTNIANYDVGSDPIFPIELYRFKDGYYVVRAVENDKDLIGSRLLEINGFRIEDIEEKLSKLIPHENMYWVYRNISPFIVNQNILKHFDIASQRNVEFTFMDQGKYL